MSGASGAGLRERTTTYAIRDAGGRLVACHVREDLPDGTKKVRWKQPDGRWGLNGTRLADLPLYGAEMVSDLGEDELIVLTEGEKTRDALEVVGIPAVGTVTGASITPGAEALEVLRGRRVALWADNDDAGRAHMQRIVETLHDVAAEVLIYTWDEAPENGDAADHPAVKSRNSKAVDRLLIDLEGSPRWKPPSVAGERSARNLPFKSGREIAETAPEEVPWTCRPWAAKRAITEVTGAVKQAGKTTFLTHMCRKILDGEDFMGERTVKTPIVYLTEQQPSSFREALGRASLLDREDFVTLAWHDTIGIPWPKVARAAADEAERIGAQVLVVDTLGQFASLKGDAENNAGAALEALRPLQEAAARGLAVILVRHDRKGGGVVGESGRGSSAFAGVVDIILAIRRGDGNTRPTVRKIESLSRFSETPTELMVELGDEGYRSLGTETAIAASEARKAVLGAAPTSEENASTVGELFEAAQVNDSTGNRAISRLLDEGELERTGKGKKGSPYRYWRPDPAGNDDREMLSFQSPTPEVEEGKDSYEKADNDGELHSFQGPRGTKRKHSGDLDSDILSFQTSTPGAEERKERNLSSMEGEVARLFADPPGWLGKQIAEYRAQGSPERLLNPLAAAVSSHLFGSPARWREVLPEVRKALEEVAM